MELGIQIGGVLMALMFLVFLILGFKSWKWFHVFMTFLVMGVAITYCIYAAMGDKTRRAWAEKYKTEKEAAEKAERSGFQLVNGIPHPKSGNPEPGLIELRGAYARATVGRSIVYRNCTLAAPFDGRSPVTVSIPKPPPSIAPGEEAAAPPAATKLHKLEKDWHVYVFLERPLTRDGDKYPVDYVGEFLVTGVTESEITMEPTLPPLAPSATDANNTWAIYEEIPSDRQNYIDDLRDPEVVERIFPGAGFNLDDQVAAQENQRILQAIFPAARLGLDAGSDEYKQFLRQFRFDGWALNKINSVLAAEDGSEFDPPPEETWARIEFTKPEKIEVDSPQEDKITGASGPDATISDVFDADGRAISNVLRQGGPTEIDLDVEELREGVFDNIPIEAPAAGDTERLGTAAAWEAADKAKIVERVFVRKLNDFRHHFRQVYQVTKLLDMQMLELNREIARIKAATLNVDAQSVIRDDERTKLNADRANFTDQYEKAKRHADQLEKDLAAKKARIDALLADIGRHETKLASLNQIMEQAVLRRAQAVSAESP